MILIIAFISMYFSCSPKEKEIQVELFPATGISQELGLTDWRVGDIPADSLSGNYAVNWV
jgi:hypothetical protein